MAEASANHSFDVAVTRRRTKGVHSVIRESRQRTTSAEEREQLEAFLARYPSRFRKGAENTLVAWAAFTLGVAVVWGVIAWMGRQLTGVDFGWHSKGAWVALGAVAACGLAALVSTRHWMSSWKDVRPLVRSDLAAGIVTEEMLRFTEVKRFQEPEHGGLVYFLRSEDDEAFVLFDHESQDPGVDGRNPLGSGFSPRSDLLLVRAPLSRFVLAKTFSGVDLQLPSPRELTAPPRSWPETEEFCGVTWADLERSYSA